ncbi:hypothetical protein BUALT_Bualt10G0055700 [Buddleja alternifolia]|uniref:2-C-methyl-D-erythritol 2,4-cyclodiphosphate synthase domain-containing protein n=1 Tax=Buddleja alternifolia TaxID=168488 RepID=A0AAV6X3K2_9LAMI|nr:hypothetical protein BUALT_Bualt10G0055700 [Buddleja alternifolia]
MALTTASTYSTTPLPAKALLKQSPLHLLGAWVTRHAIPYLKLTTRPSSSWPQQPAPLKRSRRRRSPLHRKFYPFAWATTLIFIGWSRGILSSSVVLAFLIKEAAKPTPMVRLMHEAGYERGNLDATLILQRPKVSPHKEAIRANLCKLLGADPSVVNLKAKTHEKVDRVGENRSIAAHTFVLLMKNPTLIMQKETVPIGSEILLINA